MLILLAVIQLSIFSITPSCCPVRAVLFRQATLLDLLPAADSGAFSFATQRGSPPSSAFAIARTGRGTTLLKVQPRSKAEGARDRWAAERSGLHGRRRAETITGIGYREARSASLHCVASQWCDFLPTPEVLSARHILPCRSRVSFTFTLCANIRPQSST